MDGAKIFCLHMVKARIFFFAKTRARIFFSKKTQAPPGSLMVAPLYSIALLLTVWIGDFTSAMTFILASCLYLGGVHLEFDEDGKLVI